MSVDLDRAFDQLRTHTNVVALPPAPAVRRRGDQRRRTRTAAALIGLVALVSLTSAGVVLTLGAPATVQPGLTPTSTPSVAPSPSSPSSVTPSATPEPPPNTRAAAPPGCGLDEFYQSIPFPYAGTPLPRSVMLEAADWNIACFALVYDAPGYEANDPNLSWPSPVVCSGGREYAAHQHRVAGRFRIFVGGPELSGTESVTRYAPGRAAEFLDEVRAQVASCATEERDGERSYAFIAQSGFAGDDSMIIYKGASPTGGGHPGTYQAVVRVGDLVVLVYPGFDGGGDEAYTVEMAQKAVARL